MEITKIIRTETGHRLTNYSGKCAHLHGHSYTWEITVKGDNNDNGMVMDFKVLKEILKRTVDKLDHAFVLHDQDPLVARIGVDTVCNLFEATNGETPRLFFVAFNPTVENLVKWQGKEIAVNLPVGVILSKITCWETEDSYCTINFEEEQCQHTI